MLTRRNESILWLALLLLAAVVRLAPIAASLPYIDYVDEGYALHQSIHLLNQRTLDTAWYGYPSLPAYLTAAALWAWNPVYRNVHGHHFRNDLPAERLAQTNAGYNYDLISPPELIVAGRIVAAGLGIATVLLAGALASRLRGRAAGYLAMAITALCPALVLRASNVIVDTFAAFFAVLAIYFCERIRPNERRNAIYSAAAGFTAGLAFASKYPAGAVFAAVAFVLWKFPVKDLRSRLGLIAGGGLILGIVLGAPAVVFNWQSVLRDVATTAANYDAMKSSPGYFGQAIGSAELGWLMAIAGCAGFVLMLRRDATRTAAISWLVFAIVLLAPFVMRPFQPFRNLLPLVPLICVAAAIAFADLLDLARRGRPKWLWIGGAAAFIAISTATLAFSSVRPVWQRIVRRDSRTQAIDWLGERVTKRQTVLGITELAILPAEWKRLGGPVTIVSVAHAAGLLERQRFDYVVTGEFDLRYAPDPGRASAALGRLQERLAPFLREAEFGAGPAFVVPYLWRSNDERIVILRPAPAKSD
ncbi:MAG TPA: glycosyltransferase family 39 protein [Chthoniobacterales bacterium]|nr:glycosyltransferase family 39 protein [Chthoniobacterales bacterium]